MEHKAEDWLLLCLLAWFIIIFIIVDLKIQHLVKWSWFWALTPVWAPFAVFALIIIAWLLFLMIWGVKT